MLNKDCNKIEIFSFLFLYQTKSQTISRYYLSCLKALLKVGSFYGLRCSEPAPLTWFWEWVQRGAIHSWALVGDGSSKGKRTFWHPLYYFSGSTERVNFNFILPYLRDKGVQGFTSFDKYIKEQRFLNKEALDREFASVSLLLLAAECVPPSFSLAWGMFAAWLWERHSDGAITC